MTDNEIRKALERCFARGFDESTCYECPFYTATAKCTEDLRDSALDLINRQKAENESLKVDLAKCSIRLDNLYKTADEIKSEAIKEFAERLKEKLQWDVEFDNKLVFESDIENLVKEMTEV